MSDAVKRAGIPERYSGHFQRRQARKAPFCAGRLPVLRAPGPGRFFALFTARRGERPFIKDSKTFPAFVDFFPAARYNGIM